MKDVINSDLTTTLSQQDVTTIENVLKICYPDLDAQRLHELEKNIVILLDVVKLLKKVFCMPERDPISNKDNDSSQV